MYPMACHTLFEGLAWVLAIAIGWWTRWRCFCRHRAAPMPGQRYPIYLLLLLPWGVDFGDGVHRRPVQLLK
jgi:hypothetical protein